MLRARSARPTLASIARPRSFRSAELSDAAAPYSSGNWTFSSALVRGSRLKLWNTKPMRLLRMSASSGSDSCATSRPSKKYWPLVGRSRQPMMFIIVDLPDPDDPMMATNSPAATETLTACRACTSVSPS